MQGDMCHSPRLTPTCGSGHFSGQVYSASVDRMQEHRDTTPSESASVSMLIYTYCSTKPKSLLHVPSPPFLSFVFLPSTKAQLTLSMLTMAQHLHFYLSDQLVGPSPTPELNTVQKECTPRCHLSS